jgi:hypothetical protein
VNCRHPKKHRVIEVRNEALIETCTKCGAQRTGRMSPRWTRFRQPVVRIVRTPGAKGV